MKNPPLRTFRRELALTGGIGLLFAMACLLLARSHMVGPLSFSALDFPEHCGIVASWDSAEGMPGLDRHSRVAALPAALLVSRLGVIDSLLATAFMATALVGAGIYTWARVLGGRLAGAVALVMALAMSPIVLTTRLLNFYPVFTAVFVLTAAAVAVALVRPRLAAIGAAGIGIGCTLIVDTRGLIWAAAFLPAAVLAACWLRNGLQRTVGLALLLASLTLSWGAARWAWPAAARAGLEEQVDTTHVMAARGSSEHAGQTVRRGGFVWGYSSLGSLPTTFGFLVEQGLASPPAEVVEKFPSERASFDGQVQPWLSLAWVVTALSALLLLRRPRALLALVLTVAPFAAALQGMRATYEVALRFLVHILPALPVLVGVAAGGLASILQNQVRSTAARRAPVVLVVVMAAMVLGLMPGPLAPDAAWRTPWRPPSTHLEWMRSWVEEGRTFHNRWAPVCAAALREEAAQRDAFSSRVDVGTRDLRPCPSRGTVEGHGRGTSSVVPSAFEPMPRR